MGDPETIADDRATAGHSPWKVTATAADTGQSSSSK
jgi:hypothetical protein